MDKLREKIRRLMITINRVDGLYYHAAKQAGTKENMLSLLYALSDGKPHSQKQICEEWLIPRTTINTVVKEGIRSGYVVLISTSSKEKLVALTEKGGVYTEELLENLYRAEYVAMRQTLEKYSDDFVSAIEYFTAVLGENLMEDCEEK